VAFRPVVFGLSAAGCGSETLGLVERLDVAPFVAWLTVLSAPMQEGYAEQIGLAVSCVSRSAAFCNDGEAEGLKLTNCGRDRMAMDSVLDELLERHGQSAVILAAMLGTLDF
jgi:hypothetical protein